MGTISCSCIAIGQVGKLLSEAGGTAPRTFDNGSLRHEFVYENVGTERMVQHTGAITGSLSRFDSGTRESPYLTQGSIAIQPSPVQLTQWLPRIFGGAVSGTNIPLADVLPTFDLLIFRDNGIFQYTDCVVAQAMIRGRTSNGGKSLSFLEMIINIIGKEEQIDQVSWPSPEPALPTGVENLPYIFPEATFSLDGDNVEMESFSMMVDNNLAVKFFNKSFPGCIRATRRDIKLDLKTPFTCDTLDSALLYNTVSDIGELKFTTTGMSTAFAFSALRNTFKTPTIPGNQDIPMEYGFQAFRTAANPEVTITHDATPPA